MNSVFFSKQSVGKLGLHRGEVGFLWGGRVGHLTFVGSKKQAKVGGGLGNSERNWGQAGIEPGTGWG